MIYNKHVPGWPRDAVLVDRTTAYGNPYRMVIATTTERLKALIYFCKYLQGNSALVRDIQRNCRGRDLVCWCAPRDCHAEVIEAVAHSVEPTIFLAMAVVKYEAKLSAVIAATTGAVRNGKGQ